MKGFQNAGKGLLNPGKGLLKPRKGPLSMVKNFLNKEVKNQGKDDIIK